MERVDTIIIGGGVIGLAIARALAQKGREVLILESEAAVGSITSARNSGVIHAGIYYRPGDLKARLCVEGRKRLYAYAEERGIAFKHCGKLIVAATDEQITKLQEWKATAEQNGVNDLRLLSAQEAKAMEPEVACVAALHSPSTGILDTHNYILSLLGDAEAAGATLALRAPVTGGKITDDGFVLDVGDDSGERLRVAQSEPNNPQMQIACRNLINSAGLGAQDFSRKLQGLDATTVPPLVLAKGNYFSMSGKPPFKMLIYPLPVLGSSGLHATCDLSGRIRFGPDVEWVDHIDYRVDPARLKSFEDAVRHYYPGLPPDALAPDYCGIRPKLARASPHDSDFVIQTAAQHKIPNLINLYGIESPGLTSSLALADAVAAKVA